MSDAVGQPPGDRDAVWQRRYRTLLTLLGITGLVLVLLLIALGLWWRGLQEQRLLARSTPAPLTRPEPTHPLPVAVVTPTLAIVAETVRLPVTRAVPASRRVTTPTAGRLVSLAPSGAQVEAGQVVARVETTRRVAVRARRDPGDSFQTTVDRVAPKPLLSPVAGRLSPGRAVQAARRRLEQAVQATRTAGQKLAAARQTQARRPVIQAAVGREIATSEAAVARAQSELEECDSALRVSERLYRAGAASRAEVAADADARAAAARRLAQAQERARSARVVPAASLPSSPPSAASDLAAAERQVARAVSEVAAAREAFRAATRAVPSTVTLPTPNPGVRRQASGVSKGKVSRSERSLADASRLTPHAWKEIVRTVPVRAPVSGIVTRLSASAGGRVRLGAVLLRVESGTRNSYRAEGPASRLRGIQLPTTARLVTSSGEAVPARLSALAAPTKDRTRLRITPQPRTASDRERLEAAKQLWVELQTPGPVRTLGVPGTAVHATPEGPAVWLARRTAQDGHSAWTAHRQNVQVSRREGATALIGRGLKPDSRVIIAGTEQLREGQAVAAIPWRLP